MKKILFLHGFFASGQCVPAVALREAFEGRVEVLTPDLPIHPQMALEEIRNICDREHPDLLVGNSCGSLYAQMLAPIVGIPALLGNPHFQMTAFLKERIGSHEYKAPRKDGNQQFVIDESLIQEFAELETIQFRYCNPYYKDGDCSVNKTLLLTSSHCFWSITTIHSTFLVLTLQRQKKYAHGIFQ